ncbi:guanine deaminase [Penicillium macrosclerotiorum]|uniref:guanine deaminase n=1 Tax=Penicillium macrosclerotiorum TaxID=303699 RepID=UPI002547CC0C|nr:guanine deaminase [Penicillium macrosclerotiorum]KAJ5691940.1 guanine deaminase [Penicillium macrosclerotiorum]
MADVTFTVYRGTFIQAPRMPETELQAKPKIELVRNRGALWVSAADGRIKGFDWQVQDDESFNVLLNRNGWVDVDAGVDQRVNGSAEGAVKVKVVIASEQKNEFFFPGFIDTHIHAPQFPNVGLFGSSTLLDWLETYTFPVESGFGAQADAKNGKATLPKDAPPSALRIYDQVVARTLSNGTTCASYFATIHVPATNALAALCHARGQRAFIGRVCMDNPDFCPSYYKDLSADDSVSATKSTIEYIHTLDPHGALVKPIVTPRFAPTCTEPALSGLGALAASYTPPLHIQTHISENTDEIALVHSLFPDAPSYAAVYDKHNLLTPRTILAHAVHLTPSERALIRSRNAKISHCPASNSAISSGIAPVRTLLDDGLIVGLGTDVSGGYSPSVLEAVRQACLVSRLLEHTAAFAQQAEKPIVSREKLSVEESLYLATRGGAAVVDMADELGGFEEGMLWDAQLIQLGAVPVLSESENPLEGVTRENLVRAGPVGNVDLFGAETWEEKVHKWVWSGDDRNVKAVWVSGRLVHTRN